MALKTQTAYEGPAEIQFNNRTLAEATSVRVAITPNSTPVRTMKKGFAGRSSGPVESSIDVESAVPKAGLEDDFIGACVDNADVTVTYLLAGKRYSFDGFVSSVNASNGTGAASTLSFSVMAGRPRRS